MFYQNNTPYMCDGPDSFQKQMSKQERHFSSIEFTWRYHPLSFIQNSVKYTEFCRVGKSHKKKCSCQLKKVLQCVVQIGCPTQMNGIDCRLFAVMDCLHIFDGVAINPSIFTQEHIARLYKVRLYMLGYEENARRFYICSIFPCLQAVISHNLLSAVILKYSRCFPLAVPVVMKHIKINVNGSEFGTTTTNPGPGLIVCELNQDHQTHLLLEANIDIYLFGMKLHHCL